MDSSFSLSLKWQRMVHCLVEHESVLSACHSKQQFNKLVWVRFIHQNILIFFLQYAGLMFSSLASPFSICWFASGTACAFIFLRGFKIIPGLWVGSFLAYVMAGLNPVLACSSATILTLQAVLLRECSYRYLTPSLVFFERRLFIKASIACFTLTSLSAFLLASLGFSALSKPGSFIFLILNWALANFNGTLILACALFTWDAYFPDIHRLKKINRMTASLLFTTIIFAVVGLLLSSSWWELALFSSFIFMLTLRCAYLWKWCGSLAAIFIVAFLLSFADIFAVPLPLSREPHLILYLQIFLSVLTLSTLFFAIEKAS